MGNISTLSFNEEVFYLFKKHEMILETVSLIRNIEINLNKLENNP